MYDDGDSGRYVLPIKRDNLPGKDKRDKNRAKRKRKNKR